jgi:tryptophan-rich sensory protein
MTITPETRKFQFLPFIISLAVTLFIGIVASLFTRPQINGWYSLLNKPVFTPPSWVFAPVWTCVYILIAVSAYLVWIRRDGSTDYLTARMVYIMQLALNFAWSIIFFGLHSLVGGLLVIILLWMMILLNIRWFGKLSKMASWLLMPYFLWVSYAAILNYSIFTLNR